MNLSTKQAAAFLGVKPNTLQKWRGKKNKNCPKIPFYPIGGRIFYNSDDLKEFVEKIKSI